MFCKKNTFYRNRPATIVSGLGYMSLKDTLECGQAFRYEKLIDEEKAKKEKFEEMLKQVEEKLK